MREGHFSDKAKGEFVIRYYKSGLTLSRFCLKQGLAQSSLRNWLKILRFEKQSSAPGCFVPIGLVEMDGGLHPVVLPF